MSLMGFLRFASYEDLAEQSSHIKKKGECGTKCEAFSTT